MSKRRKTREEKIIAELRHKLELQQSSPKIQASEAEIKKVKEKEIVINKPAFNINTALPIKQTAVLNYDYSYVRRDLLKTILLTIVASSAFIVLYWGMELNGVKLFIK